MNRRDILKCFSGAGVASAIPELQKLECRPGENFVLELNEGLSMDEATEIQYKWAKFWEGKDQDYKPKLLILSGGHLRKIS